MPDLSPLAAAVGELLKQRGDTIAVTESSCGGLISAALVSIPGASAYFVGGAVVYTAKAREDFLGIDLDDHPGMRSASLEYATLLAKTARQKLGTTWALSETGASGPTGNSYGDSAGHACIAVSGPIERAITLETGDADREANMWVFAKAAFDLLEQCIRESRCPRPILQFRELVL